MSSKIHCTGCSGFFWSVFKVTKFNLPKYSRPYNCECEPLSNIISTSTHEAPIALIDASCFGLLPANSNYSHVIGGLQCGSTYDRLMDVRRYEHCPRSEE